MKLETRLLTGLIKLIGREKPFAWAKRMGIPGPTFSRVWHQGGQLKSDHLSLIAKETGVSLDWLLLDIGPMYVHEKANPKPLNESGEYPAALQAADNIDPTATDAFIEVMTSNEKNTIVALTKNLFELRDKVRMQKEIIELKKDMDAIKRRLFDEPKGSDIKTQEG